MNSITAPSSRRSGVDWDWLREEGAEIEFTIQALLGATTETLPDGRTPAMDPWYPVGWTTYTPEDPQDGRVLYSLTYDSASLVDLDDPTNTGTLFDRWRTLVQETP